MRKYFHQFVHRYLENKTFREFFALDLTPVEESLARNAIGKKYSITIFDSFLWSLLALPAIIYLDTTIIVLVLTPIAMVSGTAWFMMSLSAVKSKFAKFGFDLTKHILESFIISLFLLLFMAIYALNTQALSFFHNINSLALFWIEIISGIFAAISILRIVQLIIVGSIKYDMNDAMLTGQNEAAQEFFTKSLSFSYQVTDLIRKEPDLQTTNYYISDAFSRIFNSAKDLLIDRKKEGWEAKVSQVEALNNKALTVLRFPSMDQNKVYEIFFELLDGFKGLLNPHNKAAKKIGYVNIECDCLKNNTTDSYRAKALRYATIFNLIHEIITAEGEDIFL